MDQIENVEIEEYEDEMRHDILDSLSPDYIRQWSADAEPLVVPVYESVR
jgi:hypothetical protein